MVKCAPVLINWIRSESPAYEKSKKMKKKAQAAPKVAAKKPVAAKPCAKKRAAVKPVLKSVTFTVHAEAGQEVRLAGSFTDWETKAKKMTFKKKNGVYSATVKLAPGEYQYKFIIGDKWATDDQNTEFVPNDKGTFNSKLVVK